MIKNKLGLHILYVLIASLLTALFPYYLDIHPRLRANLSTTAYGFLAFIPILAISLLCYFIFLMLFKKTLTKHLKIEIESIKKLSFLENLGVVLAKSAANELLLRCAIFAYLLTINVALAFCVNALLSFLTKSSLRKTFLLAIITGVEGSLLAYLYFNKQSYFSLFIASFLVSFFYRFFLKTRWFEMSLDYMDNFKLFGSKT